MAHCSSILCRYGVLGTPDFCQGSKPKHGRVGAHYALGVLQAHTLQQGPPSFALTNPLRISTTSVRRQNQPSLLEGLGRPRSPGWRKGAPLGEVSNRSQQTALLPRPGSWDPQPQPQSEGARALLGGQGEWGGGVWPRSQPAIRGSVCRHGFPEAPKGKRAAERALVSGRGWKELVLDPAVSFGFLTRCKSQRHGFWLRWES